MSISLSNLSCVPEFPIAGAKNRLWVIRWEDVFYVPKSKDGNVIPTDDPVKIKPGTAFKYYDLEKDTISWKEDEVKTPQGTHYQQELKGFRPKNEPEHNHEIFKLGPGHYILYFTDNEYQTRLLGTLDHPFEFTSKAGIESETGGRNGVSWIFKGKTAKPVPYVDPATEIPNEIPIPLARLSLLEVALSSGCGARISTSGSKLADGTLISSTTIAAEATLKYSFWFGATELYTASIAPNADPSVIGNWTYISGSRTQNDFEAQIVDNIQPISNSVLFDLDLAILSILDPGLTLTIKLIVDDGENESNQVSQPYPLCQIAEAFSMTTMKQTNFTIALKLFTEEDIYIDWGDGQLEEFLAVPAETETDYVHTYSSLGIYDVKVYTPLISVDEIEVNSQELIDLDISKLSQMTEIEAAGNDIATPQDLQNLIAAERIVYNINPSLTTLYPPTSAPVTQFWAYNCDIQNNLDLTPLSATLEEVYVYGNNNLAYLDVSGCSQLRLLLANSCNIQNDQILTGCTALEEIRLQGNLSLTHLDVSGLSNLHTIRAQSCDISNYQDWTDLTSLSAVVIYGNNNLPGVTLPVSAPLDEFLAYSCDISNNLDFTAFAATLTEVRLNGNSNLTFVDVSGCTALEKYRAFSCNLQNAQDLTGCTALDQLELYNNPSLANVDVAGLTNLRIYRVRTCAIANAQDVSSAGTSLEEVTIYGNVIPSLAIGTHPNLTILDAHINSISGVLNLNNCVGLLQVDLDNNNLTDVITDQCTQLTLLSIENNDIDTTELNRSVVDTWTNRSASAALNKTYMIGGNLGTLSADSVDRINGTGSYLGDGLVDHNWNVTT